MAHCPYKHLADLKNFLAAIRRLPGIVEPKPGIFLSRAQGVSSLSSHERVSYGRRARGKKMGSSYEDSLRRERAIAEAFSIRGEAALQGHGQSRPSYKKDLSSR
jgi:hypothetical protein